MVTRWIGVLGTHGWTTDPTRAWWHYESPFSRFLRAQGFDHARPVQPFVWSGDLQGVPLVGGGNDWEAGAAALSYYVRELPYEERNVIAHSHGGQCVLLSAAAGTIFRRVILVSTPVRKAIERETLPLAVPRIGRLLHLCDASRDWIGLAGGFFDRQFSLRRTFTGIDSRPVKGIGHSGLLYDAALFERWTTDGWLDLVREAVPRDRDLVAGV